MKELIVLSFFITASLGRAAIILWANQEIAIPNSSVGVYLNPATGETHTSESVGFSNTAVNFFFRGQGILSTEDFMPARVGTGRLDPIRRLYPGDLVNGTLTFGPQGNGGSSGHVSTVPAPDQFESGVPGYLGFQLDLNEDGQYVFGWMRVTFSSGAEEAAIHEWAYRTAPGQEIIVGVVPEPSTWVGGFLGACMVMAFQRKRKGG